MLACSGNCPSPSSPTHLLEHVVAKAVQAEEQELAQPARLASGNKNRGGQGETKGFHQLLTTSSLPKLCACP